MRRRKKSPDTREKGEKYFIHSDAGEVGGLVRSHVSTIEQRIEIPINISTSRTCNMYASASANPRIVPNRGASRLRFFVSFSSSSSSRSPPDVVGFAKRAPRERVPVRRIETKCTATKMIIDT